MAALKVVPMPTSARANVYDWTLQNSGVGFFGIECQRLECWKRGLQINKVLIFSPISGT